MTIYHLNQNKIYLLGIYKLPEKLELYAVFYEMVCFDIVLDVASRGDLKHTPVNRLNLVNLPFRSSHSSQGSHPILNISTLPLF